MSKYQTSTGELAFVIGLCNGKGGPGKTTIALNTVVELFDQGRRVALIDCEEEGINADALNRFEPRVETRKARSAYDIDDAIEELSKTNDIIILDAPGQTSGDEVATICSVADLVVTPIKCSKKDVRGSQSVLRMIHRQQHRNNGKPESVIVLNEVQPVGEGRKSIIADSYRKQLVSLGYKVADCELRYYEWHRYCEFVTRDPNANRAKRSDKAAMDISQFVYEVVVSRMAPVERVGNE